MKKKKLIQFIAVAVVLAAATAIAVYAYLQNTVEQPNTFTIGEDKVSVTEAFTEPETMAMTSTVDKLVKVENTGSSEQFVRVYLDFSDSRIRDKSKLVFTDGNSSAEYSWEDFLTHLPTDWEYIPENTAGDEILGGYFYYKKILSPGDETTALIERVKTTFASGDNTDHISDFDIVVYSESVQTTEIDPSGTKYTDSDWKTAWKSFLELSKE